MSDGAPITRHAKEAKQKQQPAKPVAQGPAVRLEEDVLLSVQRAVLDPGRASPADILTLQRAAGNRAVSRLIQAKLAVGPVGDLYEQEADRVAEQVVGQQPAASSQQPGVQRQDEEEEIQTKPLAATITPIVQRQEDEEEIQTQPLLQRQEDEEEIQTKPLVQRQEDEEEIQTKPLLQRQSYPPGGAATNKAQAVGQTLETELAEERGHGRPLPENTRTHMEGLFGTDLSGVRIHTDQRAAHLSRAVNARAFTLQQDIFFNEGHYNPDNARGKELLAHELTHVLQQTGRPQASLIVSQPGDREEQEANTVASMVRQVETMGQPATVPQIRTRAAQLPGTVQRAVTAGKVAKGLGKAFLMSFVNAIAGPLSYIWTFGDRRKEWRRIGGQMSYGQGKLANAARVMAKAAIFLRELAMFAGWTSLLTGVGALIAAAFAPVGLAASAVLGTISTIAGLVAMGAGALQGIINLVLGIGNLIRLRGVDDKIERSKIKVMALRDFVGALSGLIGAVGGAVGFGAGGGSVMQSTGDIAGKSMGELGKEFAIGTGAIGQSFAFAGEAQSAMGELAEQEVKQKIRPLKRVAQFGKRHLGVGKVAQVQSGLKPTPPRLPPRNQPPPPPPHLKPVSTTRHRNRT
jgi:hypothetical protein